MCFIITQKNSIKTKQIIEKYRKTLRDKLLAVFSLYLLIRFFKLKRGAYYFATKHLQDIA